MTSVMDMTQQLDSLVFRGFLQQVPYAHLKDYPRFLKAVEIRAEKLSQAAGKDQQRMREMAVLQRKWRERSAAAREAGRQDTRLEEIRWMLEELRISFFAQQIGTAYHTVMGGTADEPPVQRKDLKRETRDHGDQVVPLGRWNSLHGSWLAPSHGRTVQDRPEEERGEQHQVGQHAVGEQM